MSKLETNTIDTISGSNTLTLGGTNLTTVNMASGVSPGTGMGKVLQVVSTAKTDEFVTTAGGASPVTITGLTATITPSSTSSKILVMPTVSIGTSSNNHIGFTLFRDSTAIGIGDASGVRPRNSFVGSVYIGTATWNMQSAAFNFLDTPSSSSSIVYSIKVGGNGSAQIRINKSGRDTNGADEDGRYASTITLMEIAG
jgi:hypothetical protein|tara:strand:+ start:15 stop:608 length:594 start_codon:yes stop_codon:yes gene_type:complete